MSSVECRNGERHRPRQWFFKVFMENIMKQRKKNAQYLGIRRGNHAMNEVYGGRNGAMHWGLGLTPFTQYHLDIITPGTVIHNHRNEVIFGEAQS